MIHQDGNGPGHALNRYFGDGFYPEYKRGIRHILGMQMKKGKDAGYQKKDTVKEEE
jgi:hypothetical protein